MAGEWIKMRAQLLQSPKLLAMSRALHAHRQFREWLTPGGGGAANGQVVSDDALRCVTCALLLRVWSAAREFGKFDGDDLVLDGIEVRDIDTIAGCFGVGESMVAVGWAEFEQGALVLPKFKQHNAPMTNAERQSEFRRRRKPTDLETEEDDYALHERNADAVTTPLPDERRARGEKPFAKGDRKAKGSADAKSGVSAPQPALRSSRSPRSPVDARAEGGKPKPLDLSGVDWDRVGDLAESVGRKIPARTIDDRRMWFKFAVLVESGTFTEEWLRDGVAAVLNATETRTTRQAHLVGVLKAKAADENGIDGGTFLKLLEGIEIPNAVWKSGVLEIRK